MNRLTMWYDGNHAICENEECSSGDCPFADPICEQVQNIIDRLAAYEDTGLEPEEIGALKSREKGLVELLNGVSCGCAVTYTRLRELAQADREGRCVVLPPDDYAWTIRGDIVRGIIKANCRAAEKETEAARREQDAGLFQL